MSGGVPGLTNAHIHTGQTLMRGLLSTLQKTRSLRGTPSHNRNAVGAEEPLGMAIVGG